MAKDGDRVAAEVAGSEKEICNDGGGDQKLVRRDNSESGGDSVVPSA